MSSLASALIAYARTGGKNFTPVAKALMRGPSERSSQSPGMREPGRQESSDWRGDLLKSIGAPITDSNLRFLSAWQRWEGGHTNNDATYNWLNTTQGQGRRINPVGVKAFPSYQAGIQNTAATLLNGRYRDIVSGLRSGNPYAANLTAGLSTWVSGSPTGNTKYAAKIMNSPASASGQRGGTGIAEAFYDPLGAYDEGRWIKPIGGHSDHVHVSFNTPQAALAAITQAKKMGLRAGENPYTDPVDPVHVPNSYHYRNFSGQYNGRQLGMGLDVSGKSALMARYYQWLVDTYGLGSPR